MADTVHQLANNSTLPIQSPGHQPEMIGLDYWLAYVTFYLIAGSQIICQLLRFWELVLLLTIKKLREKVDNFDFSKWKDLCKAIMKSGLLPKLSQNVHCFMALEATHDIVLVEASPYDKFGGAGLSIKDTDLAICKCRREKI